MWFVRLLAYLWYVCNVALCMLYGDVIRLVLVWFFASNAIPNKPRRIQVNSKSSVRNTMISHVTIMIHIIMTTWHSWFLWLHADFSAKKSEFNFSLLKIMKRIEHIAKIHNYLTVYLQTLFLTKIAFNSTPESLFSMQSKIIKWVMINS